MSHRVALSDIDSARASTVAGGVMGARVLDTGQELIRADDAAEVDIDTFGQRYVAELATSGAVHTLPPVMRAWTRLPTAWAPVPPIGTRWSRLIALMAAISSQFAEIHRSALQIAGACTRHT
jgi:hypothetical protein